MQIYNAMAIDREGRDNGNMMRTYTPTAAPVFHAINAIVSLTPENTGRQVNLPRDWCSGAKKYFFYSATGSFQLKKPHAMSYEAMPILNQAASNASHDCIMHLLFPLTPNSQHS